MNEDESEDEEEEEIMGEGGEVPKWWRPASKPPR